MVFWEHSSKSLKYDGILASFTEGQQETIVQDIENMVRSYVEKVNYTLDIKGTMQ